MFNISVNDKKNIYRSKPVMNVDTTGSSGGGSIPKPLTYDYMPEGYPSKSMGLVTLMEEQEVAFTNSDGIYQATAPVQFDISDGQTYTAVWDGVEDSCVCHVIQNIDYIGNPAALGLESTGEPFLYAINGGQYLWVSYDTSTSHTIKVIGKKETYKKIDENFLPKYVSCEVQDLTDEEKTIARNNVNALSKDVLVEIPTNIVLASDFERYYEKYKETGLPIKWDGHIITYIDHYFTDNGLKYYVFSTGRVLFRTKEYIYNEKKYVSFSSHDGFYNDIYADQIQFKSNIGESNKTISLDPLDNLRTNDGGMVMIWNDGVVVYSCTQDSTKKFKITVDDSGTISATEVT